VPWREEGKARARDGEEGKVGEAEVECGKGELCEFQRGFGEDGFVGEDLVMGGQWWVVKKGGGSYNAYCCQSIDGHPHQG
jgi:hypothetical protein